MPRPIQAHSREEPLTLAQELKRQRELKGMSLRAVERETGISNPYLSQLENGKIVSPSPHVLYKLANLYDLPYVKLMELAGYIQKPKKGENPKSKKPVRSLIGAALATMEDLTPEEEDEVVKFLSFLRSKRPTSMRGGKK